MATFEQIGVMFQVIDQTFRLTRNMRANAADYIAQVNAGRPVGTVATVMVADADQFLARIATMTALATRNQALLQASLAIFGLTLADANALKTTLIGVCNHVKAASLVDAAAVVTEANAILASTPNYEGLF